MIAGSVGACVGSVVALARAAVGQAAAPPPVVTPGHGLSTNPLAPAWLVLPMAVVTLLVLAGHMHAMHTAPGVPPSRRRIRSINAGLMLVTIPVLAYAFGIATPARTQAFALAWSASALLLGLIVTVALADVVNTWRLHAGERERLKLQMRALRAAAERRMDGRAGGPVGDVQRDERAPGCSHRVTPQSGRDSVARGVARVDGHGGGPSCDPPPRSASETDRPT